MILELLGIIALCILFLFIYTYIRLRAKIYQKILSYDDDLHFKVKPKHVFFSTTDNLKLSGWVFIKKNAKGTIVYSHGHGEPVGGKADEYKYIKSLVDGPFNILLYDFRGFGDSSSSKHTLGYKEAEDVSSAIDYAKENLDKPIFVVGSSMGSVSSIRACQFRRDIAGLVLIAPYKSLTSLFKKQIKRESLPAVPFLFLIQISIIFLIGVRALIDSALRAAPNIKVPLLVIRAENDQMVNRDDAKAIFYFARTEKKLLTMKGGEHNVFVSHPEETVDAITSFCLTYA